MDASLVLCPFIRVIGKSVLPIITCLSGSRKDSNNNNLQKFGKIDMVLFLGPMKKGI